MHENGEQQTSGSTGPEVCTERRRHERHECARPCKLLHPASMRYMAARTVDLSPGGALIEVRSYRPLRAGDRVDVLIDWDERGVVGRDLTVPAEVVRASAEEVSSQRVGVAFIVEQAGAAAA